MRDVVRLSRDRRGHNDKEPALTLNGAGRLWVAWQSYEAKADRILARSVVDGNLQVARDDDAWSSPIWVRVIGGV